VSFIPHFNNWQKYSLRVYYYDRVTSTGYSGTDTWIEFNAPIKITWKQEKTRLSSMDGELRDFNEGWRPYITLQFNIVTQEMYDNILLILDGISKIESEVIGWFSQISANIVEARTYNKTDSTPEARIVSLDIGKEEKAEIVYSKNNGLSIFHTSKDGQVYKLDDLGMYDPKTDRFEPKKRDKNEG
jgi:hypothetical protein